jgi:hypothetical protein
MRNPSRLPRCHPSSSCSGNSAIASTSASIAASSFFDIASSHLLSTDKADKGRKFRHPVMAITAGPSQGELIHTQN